MSYTFDMTSSAAAHDFQSAPAIPPSLDTALLAGLTDRQREAVLHRDGPLLVLAGAGSGKTRVITRRAARLAAAVGSTRILAITFTNKAAGEMRERIEKLGFERGMWVCTFHSLSARLLRMYGDRAGLSANFTIFDESDRNAAVKQALDDCGLSSEQWRPRSLVEKISQAKNQMLSPAEYAAAADDYVSRTVAKVYARYQELLTRQQGADFDDLLFLTAALLRDVAEVRAALEQRFRYVLIDEYQDTNHAQYLIARGLTQTHRNLCATGDPDQSIYGWRGANIGNILEFERDFPDATVVRLEQNFRSTQRILSAAGRLIARNHRRKKKDLWTENESGPAVRVWHCADERDEAQRIAADVERLRSAGVRAGEVALFYRVTALTRVLEDALRRINIPYQIARGVEFYNRKEIKDVLAYVRVIVNPADDSACIRAIQTPARGIGRTTIQRLSDFARAQGVSLRAALGRAAEVEGLKTAQRKVKDFAAVLDELSAHPPQPVGPLLEKLVQRSGMEAELKADPDPEKPALANVAELISAATEYDEINPEGSIADWLNQVSLVSDTDRVDLSGGMVTLMTLHAAKGLEFPHVYIVGLEEGLLPHQRSRDGGRDALEEERRLLFVGMTRAMKQLTLTRAEYRMSRGFSERTLASSFLRELPDGEIEVGEWTGGGRDAYGDDDGGYGRGGRHGERYFDDEPLPDIDERLLIQGQLVRHADYGMGRIQRVEMARGRPWVRVKFNAYGERSFSLAHAELEVVES